MQPIFHDSPHPFLRSFFIFGISLIGFALAGAAAGALIDLLFYPGHGGFASILNTSPITDPNAWMPLMIFQACSAGFGFILCPFLYLKFGEKKSLAVFTGKISLPLLGLTVFIAVLFLFPLSVVVEWNEHMDFPDWMGAFKQWAVQAEESAHELTMFFTHFETPAHFLIGLTVIAVLPAIGEELLFRGFIQNYLWKAFRSPHAAIWATAFLFSAIHLQFFGFFPRMLLGALFGYLYWQSGSLWIPIVGHFTNNALNLVLLYLHQLSLIKFDPDSNPHLPAYAVMLPLTAFVFLLFRFKKLAS